MHKTSSRLLALLSLLQTRRDWSGDELSGRLDVTARTVRRDVDRLRELGYPITAVKGPAGGYRLEAGAQLPPLIFDDDQAVAVALALQSAVAGTTLAEDAARALATIRQVMPPRLRHRMDTLRVTAVHPPGDAHDPTPDTQVLTDLATAVHAHAELRFDHVPDGAADTAAPGQRRRVQPHHLVTRHGRWYLLAWDLDREDWRTFRVDRIRPRTPTGPRFTPREVPGGDVSAFVMSRFRGSDGTGSDWPCQGVVVLGRPAADVAPFAGDGLVEALGPDRCRLTLGSWSWIALASAIGRFDTAVEVVGPPALTEAFRHLAARYADAAEGAEGAEGQAVRE
ncbi:Bifunctional ligase/repressor BirA [Streptomyces sp. YIM 130001]|uniref:helix-turn-helix transcriptional regulator n=1 Tax=Streptomyces sp. YIM 130001 TaxID=2259644 RepID=UPI000E648737|nr:WYL domain-containing protein [Streptomyces sp. YIM 130001]RII09158.1 Bifunctional ligase/repressor BirA [Streptomyces sp. YIM 130001]